MDILFSIIIPTYNRSLFIQTAITSIINQIYTNWELIIIDDGSTDNTAEIVSNFSNSKIKYIYQENAERSAARNKGIAYSSGQYICFLDSDDYFLPNFLQELHKGILNHQSPIALFGYGYKIYNQNSGKWQIIEPHPETPHLIQNLIEKFAVIPPMICAHRNILNENKFDPRFSLWEDTHLWLRVLCQYPYFSLSIFQVVQVQHNQSTVESGFARITLKDVNRYVFAINDLFKKYNTLLKPHYIIDRHRKNYIDSKLNMYLYQARCNKQFANAFTIAIKILKNKPNIISLITIQKLFVHFIIAFFSSIISKMN